LGISWDELWLPAVYRGERSRKTKKKLIVDRDKTFISTNFKRAISRRRPRLLQILPSIYWTHLDCSSRVTRLFGYIRSEKTQYIWTVKLHHSAISNSINYCPDCAKNHISSHSNPFHYLHPGCQGISRWTGGFYASISCMTTTVAWPIRGNRVDNWWICKRWRLSPKVKTLHWYIRALLIQMGLECPSWSAIKRRELEGQRSNGQAQHPERHILTTSPRRNY
jgi:hypothetical protein